MCAVSRFTLIHATKMNHFNFPCIILYRTPKNTDYFCLFSCNPQRKAELCCDKLQHLVLCKKLEVRDPSVEAVSFVKTPQLH